MSNDCLFVKLKEGGNYAVSSFLQKIDELCLCLDGVLRNKTPVNHTPSSMFTSCLPTRSLFRLIEAEMLLKVTDCTACDAILSRTTVFILEVEI